MILAARPGRRGSERRGDRRAGRRPRRRPSGRAASSTRRSLRDEPGQRPRRPSPHGRDGLRRCRRWRGSPRRGSSAGFSRARCHGCRPPRPRPRSPRRPQRPGHSPARPGPAPRPGPLVAFRKTPSIQLGHRLGPRLTRPARSGNARPVNQFRIAQSSPNRPPRSTPCPDASTQLPPSSRDPRPARLSIGLTKIHTMAITKPRP